MKRTLFASILLCAFVAACCGCDKNTFGVVDVTGKITVDGKPVEGISVSMSPVDPAANPTQRAAAGVTKEDGTFRVVTPGAKVAGVMPGDYVLTFQKEVWLTEDGELAENIPYDPSKPEPKTHPEDLLPPKYKNPANSECKVTVEAKKYKKGEVAFEFDLSSEK